MTTSQARLCLTMLIIFGAFIYGNAQTVTLVGNVRDQWNLLAIDSARIEMTNVAIPSQSFVTYTNALGNWSYALPTAVDGTPLHPQSLRLEQNYPNPFNPSTTFRFSIPASGRIRLTIHTILGELLDERTIDLTAGDYSVDWRGMGAAGVLLYSIDMNGTRITRKMIQLDGSGGNGFGTVTSTSIGSDESSASRTLSTEYSVIASRYDYDPDTATVALVPGARADFLLTSIHRGAFLIDLHNDVLEKVMGGYQLGPYHTFNHSDIPRFRLGGVDAQMFVCWPSPTQFPNNPFQRTIAMMDSFLVQVARNPLTLAHVRTGAEVDSALATGRLAGILAVEGGHAIENSMANLMTLHGRGMRYLTITWNNSTSWAVAAADPESATRGLSAFGFQVIRALDSLGVIIDVSHTGIRTIQDILDTTSNPIIASHSGVRALRNHYRNLYDDQIIAIAQRGGVIGVVFYPTFLSASGTATIDTVIRHIDYIKNLVGIDHVALGSDFDGIDTVPAGLEDVSRFPNLTQALLRRGYSRSDVYKILGGNFMRVFQLVTLRAQQASTETAGR